MGTAQARTLPASDIEREFSTISASLQQFPQSIVVKEEPALTYEKLQRELRNGHYHIWHFVGHGRIIDGRSELILEDHLRDPHSIDAHRIAGVLSGSGIRLVVLDACSGGRIVTDPFNAIAPALVKGGVPICIGMQAPVNVETSFVFAREFYQALVESHPIDTCVIEGRKAISGVAGFANHDWSLPVIYTRAPDGLLIEVQRSSPDKKSYNYEPLLHLLTVNEEGLPRLEQEEERISVGRMLGEHGDSRIDIQSNSYWCTVPAGPFIMGSDVLDSIAKRSEKPQRKIELPAFRIARYPVTNQQWHMFINAGGYDERRWWTSSGWDTCRRNGWQRPLFWDDSAFNGPNQPVVGISWYEADAYTHWLSSQLKYTITLPTEQEWEKAARGADGQIYPWGDNRDEMRANVAARHGQTTPVGVYPHAASPYGALDMVGNIAEWTSSIWVSARSSSPEQHDKARALYVVKGGSWRFAFAGARCASRDKRDPTDRLDYVGIRLKQVVGRH